MDTTTKVSSDSYSFLTDSRPEADASATMAVDDLAKVLDQSAIGFLDTDIVEQAMLAGFLDSTPPEEIETEILNRAGPFIGSLADRVLLHPRIRISESIDQELKSVRDYAQEIIARDIAAYSVSYASLEARRPRRQSNN